MVVSDEVMQRVERGAAWLDAAYPGWVDKVNLDALVLSDCRKCVLGQLAGSYNDAVVADKHLALRVRDFGFHVFSPLGRPNTFDTVHSYDELAAAWRALILARMAVAAAKTRALNEADILTPSQRVECAR